jgi:hypothetical protein
LINPMLSGSSLRAASYLLAKREAERLETAGERALSGPGGHGPAQPVVRAAGGVQTASLEFPHERQRRGASQHVEKEPIVDHYRQGA